MSTSWPLQKDAAAFYGDPASPNFASHHLTQVACPWKLHMGASPISHITINRQCAASLERVLAAVWAEIKTDAMAKKLGYDVFSGSYNYRPMRTSKALSMHAYGAAIDWDAPENAQGTTGRFTENDALTRAFEAEGWIWGGRWAGKTRDAMHFQSARVR